ARLAESHAQRSSWSRTGTRSCYTPRPRSRELHAQDPLWSRTGTSRTGTRSCCAPRPRSRPVPEALRGTMGTGTSTPPRLTRGASEIQRQWRARGFDIIELAMAMAHAGAFWNQLVRIRAGKAKRLWRRAVRLVWLALALDEKRNQLARTTRGWLHKRSPYSSCFQISGTKRFFCLSPRGLCWTARPSQPPLKGIPYDQMLRLAITGSRRSPGFLVEVRDSYWSGSVITYRFRASHEDVQMWTSALAVMMQSSCSLAAPTHVRSKPSSRRPSTASQRSEVEDPRGFMLRNLLMIHAQQSAEKVSHN
ncbi:hypothetical protein T492DRAFT_212321, partial [Pavlovales sp. CCMP2436]